jgi:hypothetical protein
MVHSHPRLTSAQYPAVNTHQSSFPPQLFHLGKEYPAGKEYFHTRLHQAFMKNKDVTNPEQIQQLIDRGNYVVKELEALYMLRKYRTLKKRYYS